MGEGACHQVRVVDGGRRRPLLAMSGWAAGASGAQGAVHSSALTSWSTDPSDGLHRVKPPRPFVPLVSRT